MFVEIGVAVKHEATSLKMRVASGAPGLLYIIFQGTGNVIVNHESHVLFVHSHAESRGGDNDAHLVCHESVLIGNFFVSLHFSVERQSLETIP